MPIVCYARVVFETETSVAEKHNCLDEARRWIEHEHQASPEAFRVGEIVVRTPEMQVVEIFDRGGWKPIKAD